ncbi:AlkA N-terminal domain-containing protein [Branchiibius cervicis]|uniref:DNA-3-methyladenine glycosylase II n=1 Tax=Branchiibius cervicis TaxID=908252 RepID=A0ABW2ANS9_9MICO
MRLSTATCLAAVHSRDARFDGWFVTAVRSTRIYCRPSCPATPPRADRIDFLPSAAAAVARGYRACKRCLPDATPGSPEWNVRDDLVARAMRLIADGVVEREGVEGLSRRLGYSSRQIERVVSEQLGAGPLAMARSQRAQTARILIETTAMPFADIAFAAGFGSIRSMNDVVRTTFALTPTQLRARRSPLRATDPPAWHRIDLRLPMRLPFWPDNVFGHLVATGVPGVEEWRDGAYRRTLRLTYGAGIVALRPAPDHVGTTVWLRDVRDLQTAVSRCRFLLDLDADPQAVDAALARDPRLAPMIAAAPGRRVPHTTDPVEMALRIVLGQQISTRAARTHAARLTAALGETISDPGGRLTGLFPTAEVVAGAPDDVLAMPTTRKRTLRSLARALADEEIDVSPGADWTRTRTRLLDVPGIGPWSVESIAMRALGDPDAFPATDLAVRRILERIGPPAGNWRPWRAYVTQHLWATLDHETNHLPTMEASA